METASIIRLRLSDKTSAYIRDQLAARGAAAGVAVVGEGSWPDAAGAIVLWLVPCDLPTANAAAAVAQGSAVARRTTTS